MAVWQIQEARRKFSTLVVRASQGEPQIITREDEPAVVMVSAAEYERLVAWRPRLIDALLSSPLVDSGIQIERDRGEHRPPLSIDG